MSHLAGVKDIASPRSSSDDFFTPVELFHELNAEFLFTLDPCGHALSPASEVIGRDGDVWFRDGLGGDWTGRVFCNPPYSEITPWVQKAHREMVFGSCDLVVMLLPANKTEQPWWQRNVEPYRDGRSHALFSIETRFISGRLKHGNPDDPCGDAATSGTFASVLLIWRKRP